MGHEQVSRVLLARAFDEADGGDTGYRALGRERHAQPAIHAIGEHLGRHVPADAEFGEAVADGVIDLGPRIPGRDTVAKFADRVDAEPGGTLLIATAKQSCGDHGERDADRIGWRGEGDRFFRQTAPKGFPRWWRLDPGRVEQQYQRFGEQRL